MSKPYICSWCRKEVTQEDIDNDEVVEIYQNEMIENPNKNNFFKYITVRVFKGYQHQLCNEALRDMIEGED